MSDEDKSKSRPRALPTWVFGPPARNKIWLMAGAVLLVALSWFFPSRSPYLLALGPSVTYTNYQLAEGPWSIQPGLRCRTRRRINRHKYCCLS